MLNLGVLIAVIILKTLTTGVEGDENCTDNRFGGNCHFECNCLNNNCAQNGTCVAVGCKDGFYGPICQKKNIALHSKNITQSPYEAFDATLAVDGNKTTYSETFGKRPYLYVDYGSKIKTQYIRVNYINRESMKICFTDHVENVEDRSKFEREIIQCFYRYRSPFTRESNPSSRYVVVYPSKRSTSTLMVSEIEVKRNLISTSKPVIKPVVTQGNHRSPKFAIDGNKYTYVETKGQNCSLMLDFGSFRTLTNLKMKIQRNYGTYEVHISNSTSIYDNGYKNPNDNSTVTYSNTFRGSSYTMWTIAIPQQVTGRYIIIRRKNKGKLRVYEVIATDVPSPVMVKQSPYEHHYPASLAFDGLEKTYSQTFAKDPYIAIDLTNISTISSVYVDIELKDNDYELCVSNSSSVYKHGNNIVTSSDRCWNKTHLNSTWEINKPGNARYVSLSSLDDGFLTLKELQVFVCQEGTYGEDCEMQCDYCKDYSCDGIKGECLNGCNSGWFGPNCSVPCPSNCMCNGSFDKCDSCKSGWFGKLCGISCPANCSDGCDQQTGLCINCLNGLYGDNCTEKCSNMCNMKNGCDKTSGKCNECKAGLYGIKCDKTCPSSCSDGGCDRQTGECLNCTAGYHGKQCTVKCPTNCNAQGCDRETGSCVGCLLGYAGISCIVPCNRSTESCVKCTTDASCSFSCPDTCTDNKCNETTGQCISCRSGYTGAICDKKCSTLCSNGKCYQNGTCTECSKGYYGPNCSLSCSENCRNKECDRLTGYCTACKDGFFGIFCAFSCPDNCGNDGCNKETKLCLSCKSGYFGNSCNVSCPGNCDGHGCEMITGKCFGCKNGYFGELCNKKCSNNCDRYGCVGDSGNCFGCKNGFYGLNCSSSCPYACDASGCSKNNGICYDCKTGYFGTKCDQACPENCFNRDCMKSSGECTKCKGNFYGRSCNLHCPKNCNYLGCDTKSGVCFKCVDGYFGQRCNLTCPESCGTSVCSFIEGNCEKCQTGNYGKKCNLKCKNTCSADGCIQTSGTCVGCMFGYYGKDCNSKCPNNCDVKGCDINSGNCFGCRNGFYGYSCNDPCPDKCDEKGCELKTGICWNLKKNISVEPKASAQTDKQAPIINQLDYGNIVGPIIGVIIINILVTVTVVLVGFYCLNRKQGGPKYKRFGDEKDENPTFNCTSLEFSNPMKDATV